MQEIDSTHANATGIPGSQKFVVSLGHNLAEWSQPVCQVLGHSTVETVMDGRILAPGSWCRRAFWSRLNRPRLPGIVIDIECNLPSTHCRFKMEMRF